MSNFFEDMEADAAAPEAVTVDKLKEITSLGELMIRKQKELAQMMENAKALAKEIEKIQREDLPTMLKEIRMRSYEMMDGGTLKLESDLTCGLTEANKPAAFKWLEETKNSGIIKTMIAVEFGRDESEEAKKLRDKIAELDPDRSVEVNRTIHPNTLKAFVKDWRSKPGVQFPDELFSVFPFDKVTYIPPAKPRARKR